MPIGDYMARDLCPLCGQDIVIPNELTSLCVGGKERVILFKLLRAKGTIVTKEVLNNGRSTTTLPVYISRLRSILRDTGLPYKIITCSDEGYMLEDL